MAKFTGLLYKFKRSYQNPKLDLLNQAYQEAESIAHNTVPEFSSGLFLWDLGNALGNLGKYEEAIASYDKALEIKPDDSPSMV